MELHFQEITNFDVLQLFDETQMGNVNGEHIKRQHNGNSPNHTSTKRKMEWYALARMMLHARYFQSKYFKLFSKNFHQKTSSMPVFHHLTQCGRRAAALALNRMVGKYFSYSKYWEFIYNLISLPYKFSVSCRCARCIHINSFQVFANN